MSGHLGYRLKAEPKLMGFADGLATEQERTRGGKDDTKVLGLSNLQAQFTEKDSKKNGRGQRYILPGA